MTRQLALAIHEHSAGVQINEMAFSDAHPFYTPPSSIPAEHVNCSIDMYIFFLL